MKIFIPLLIFLFHSLSWMFSNSSLGLLPSMVATTANHMPPSHPLVLCILFIVQQLNLMSSFTAIYCIYIDRPTSGTVQTTSNYSVSNKPETFKMRYKAVALTEHIVTALLHHYYCFSLHASFVPCDVSWIGYASKWSLLAHINCTNIRLCLQATVGHFTFRGSQF